MKYKQTRRVHVSEKFDVYCGHLAHPDAPRAGTAMFNFSNPFIGRKKSLKRYHLYFQKRLEEIGFRASLQYLRGKRLACTCTADRKCHVDKIVDYLKLSELQTD